MVPAFNEEGLIRHVLQAMPPFVDRVIVVDDASSDGTPGLVETVRASDPRVVLIRHEKNGGVGRAIVTGYQRAREEGLDVVAVMGGDGQMHPEDLLKIVTPVVRDEVDYAKGNRLFRGESWRMIPHLRYLGNSVLSLLTKIASGYWHVADSQCGYTAISKAALDCLPLEKIYPRYGMPNDLLVKLNMQNLRVRDISCGRSMESAKSQGESIRLPIALTVRRPSLFMTTSLSRSTFLPEAMPVATLEHFVIA